MKDRPPATSQPQTAMTEDRPETLDDLRREIDRLDAAMHRALMDRGAIIDRLIAVKQSAEAGSAFRPKREADMMRDLLMRHEGHLPLDTVESIWRVIISTFTFVQAPYRVHGAVSAGAAQMRDVARFHFGFTVPYMEVASGAEAVAAVAADGRDLGLIPASEAGAWWRGMGGDGRPQVIARLPFVERPGHPAALQTYVVGAPPAAGAVADDVRLLAFRGERWNPEAGKAARAAGARVVGREGTEVLAALPRGVGEAELAAAISPTGAALADAAWIGAHAAHVLPGSTTA